MTQLFSRCFVFVLLLGRQKQQTQLRQSSKEHTHRKSYSNGNCWYFAPDLEIQTCFFKSNQKSCQIPPLLSSILVLKRLRKFLSAGLWSSQGDLISLQCFSICLNRIPDNFQKGSAHFLRIQLSPKYFSQKVLYHPYNLQIKWLMVN